MANTLHENIRKRLEELNKTPQQASVEAGLSKDFLRTLFARQHGSPKADSLAKLAQALETTPDELLGQFPKRDGSSRPAKGFDSGQTLPVYGLAAGSVLGNLTMTDEPFEFVSCPPGLTRVKEAYALFVTGTSMEPAYKSGDLVFIHPYRPVRLHDHVVVQEALEGGTVTSIKRFERYTDEHIILTQYNPLAEMKISRKAITSVHRVMTTNELFGL